MSLLIKRRSEQDLTGRKRDRGTLIPWAFLKCLIAAPAAVSSCKGWVRLKYWMFARGAYLNDLCAIFVDFRVDDNLELHPFSLHDPLQGCTDKV